MDAVGYLAFFTNLGNNPMTGGQEVQPNKRREIKRQFESDSELKGWVIDFR